MSGSRPRSPDTASNEEVWTISADSRRRIVVYREHCIRLVATSENERLAGLKVIRQCRRHCVEAIRVDIVKAILTFASVIVRHLLPLK